MRWNILFTILYWLEDICLCKFSVENESGKTAIFDFCMIYTSYAYTCFTVHTMFPVVLLICDFCSFCLVSQVLVCFTYVILQTKSEENTEAIESDMGFEGVFNHDNCKRSFIANGNFTLLATLRPT